MPNEIYLNADGSLEQTILDGLATWEIQTIASGAITFAQGTTLIDTQSSAATDDLDTISFAGSPQQGEQGTILFIKASNGARTVVVKHMTGNIYNPCLTDIKLDETAKMLMLVHDGTRWVVMAGGCGGAGETVTPIVIGDVTPGNEVPCVAAARMVEYLKYIINAGKAKISNTRLEIVEALAGTIAIVQPDYSSVAVMALAATFDTTYADAAAVDAAFTTGFYDSVQDILYCADANDDGVIGVGELATVYSELTALAVARANIIASLIAILGAAGLSNAVGVSTVVAATCTGCFKCAVANSELITFASGERSRITVDNEFSSIPGDIVYDETGGPDGGPCVSAMQSSTNPVVYAYNGNLVTIIEPTSGAWNDGIVSVKFQCRWDQAPGNNATDLFFYEIFLLDASLTVLATYTKGAPGEVRNTWNTISNTFNYTGDVHYVRVRGAVGLFGDVAPEPIRIDNVCIVKRVV